MTSQRSDGESKPRKKAHKLRLPIITFDDKLDEELKARGIDTENDTDGHLYRVQADHDLTLWEYLASLGLVPQDELREGEL